jgi:hypothetical protein
MIEVLKQMVEALEFVNKSDDDGDFMNSECSARVEDAIETGLKAINELESQEPVGWIDSKGNMVCTKINESCKPLYTTPQQRKPLMLEKFREMKELLDDNPHQHKKMFTDDELKIIMETTMPVIDWKARYGVELNNGERNKWMLEWFIAFARAIEAAHGIKE